MSSQEVPVETKALGKGNRDRGTLRGGQLLPETSEPMAVVPPMPLEEMAKSVPPSSTLQLNREKAPSLRTSDKLTETEDPDQWSTVPGANAVEPPPEPEIPEGSPAAQQSSSSSSTPDESWTVAQLQGEASARGLPTSGTKAELIERLRA